MTPGALPLTPPSLFIEASTTVESTPEPGGGGPTQEPPQSHPISTNGSTREQSDEIESPEERPDEKEHSIGPASDVLRSSSLILLLAVIYTMLAVLAWTILCILTYRPITTAHYHTMIGTRNENPRSVYRRNENWLQTVRVIQSLVSVLTIPVVSAVCSKAVVVFTQNVNRRSMSLRKTITLASRGWNEPHIAIHLCKGRYRRYGSSLLLFAIVLNVLGGLISPLQSVFLHYSATKTPSSLNVIADVPDVLDLMNPLNNPDNRNRVAVLTRSAITSTFSSDPQSRLWSQGRTNCDSSYDYVINDMSGASAQLCGGQVANLANMSQLVDPFLAYLPAGFNTGLIKQFIPRLSSRVTRETITASDFPRECNTLPGAFYIHYYHPGEASNTNTAGNWSVVACMPADQKHSPWRSTRDRQDISERLYLNISMDTWSLRYPIEALLEITLNSTLGYFELPNYFNGGKPGPLSDQSPWPDDYRQLPPFGGQYRRDLNNGSAGMSTSSVLLQQVTNKGPLLNLAMALFGENSYIANRFQHPEVYIWNESNVEMWNQIDNHGVNPGLYSQVCVEQLPLMGLLMGPSISTPNGLYQGCILNLNNQDSTLNLQVENWLLALYDAFPTNVIENALEAAAFLANEAWLVKSVSSGASLFVSYDPGMDTDVPVISEAGIIVVSSLLVVFLSALLGLALYGAQTPVWTSNLDAFAMLRIGASMPDKLSFNLVRNSDKVSVLDSQPGWIGDMTEGRGGVGELGLGANTQLTMKRRVRLYENE